MLKFVLLIKHFWKKIIFRKIETISNDLENPNLAIFVRSALNFLIKNFNSDVRKIDTSQPKSC